MTKIYICDHLGNHRTTQQIEDWFANQGHEVKWSTYWEPEMGEWCDTALFAWTEGMLQRALDPKVEENKGKDILKGKRVVTYLMDIEMWAEQYHGTDWTKIDYLVYCSKYIYDVFMKDKELTQNVSVRHIPLSVNMDQWELKDRNISGRNIGVLGHMWPAKGAQMIPEFMHRLIHKTDDVNWKIFIQGEWRHDVWRWYQHYFLNLVKDLGLEKNIFINEDYVPSVSEWLNDKDYLISFSMKEAFSLPMAEGLARGIPTYTHNFPGAKEIWADENKSYVWDTIDGLIYKMTHDENTANQNREFVYSKYSNEAIMPLWEKVLL